MKYWAILAILAALLTSCGGSPVAAPTTIPVASCAEQSAGFVAQIEPIAREWNDAASLAVNTPRISLAAQIEKLQSLRRQVQDLKAPACSTVVQGSLVGTMDATIRANTAFLGQSADDTVQALHAIAKAQQAEFDQNLRHLKANEPLENFPPALTDGLGVARAALQAPFEKDGLVFKERPLADGQTASTALANDQLTTVEFIGTPENVREAYIAAGMKGFDQARVDAIKASLHRLLQTAAPDWTGGSAWLDSVIVPETGTQTIAHRGRVITYARLRAGDDTYTLSIKVP